MTNLDKVFKNMLLHEKKNLKDSYLILSISLVLYIVLILLNVIAFHLEIAIVFAVVYLSMTGSYLLTKYRMQKGFYGTNRTEAIEVIKVIKKRRNKNVYKK